MADMVRSMEPDLSQRGERLRHLFDRNQNVAIIHRSHILGGYGDHHRAAFENHGRHVGQH